MTVALITGASRGIGAAIARRLADDGMTVAINSYPDEARMLAAKNVVSEIKGVGGHAAMYVGDISDAADVDAMFTRCEAELGPVTVLVVNASATERVPWHDIAESAWDRMAAVNLKGAYFCCRRAFSTAIGGGGIVTLSSVQAELGTPHSLHYNTTKAGIIGFTRSLARELGPRGIRVNCVMPGAIRTEAESGAFQDQNAVDRAVLERQSLQRRGEPDDIAGVVSFLLGPDSGFITGQTLCVDGGWVFH